MFKVCTQLVCVSILLSIAVSPTEAGFWDWIRGRSSKGHDVCKVDIEVLDPHGIKLWTPRKPETKMFGVELYINPVYKDGKAPPCNLCVNTTEIMHGKFLIENDNLIVKKGDVLEYVAITDNGASVKRHKPRRVVVNDYLVKPKDSCSCPALVTPLVLNSPDPAAEIALLERIITGLANRCSEGAISNFLYFQELITGEGPVNLLEAVKSYLEADAKLAPFAKSVISAKEYANGVAFEMKTIIDKLKLLEAKAANTDIQDFDTLSLIDSVDIRVST